MSLRARKNRSLCCHDSIAELNISRSNASTGNSSIQLPPKKNNTTLQVNMPNHLTLGLNTQTFYKNASKEVPQSCTSAAPLPYPHIVSRQVTLKKPNNRRKTPQIMHQNKNAFPKDFFSSVPQCSSELNNQTQNTIASLQAAPSCQSAQHLNKQYSWSQTSFASNQLYLQRFRSVQQKMILANQKHRIENQQNNLLQKQLASSVVVAAPSLLLTYKQAPSSDYSRWVEQGTLVQLSPPGGRYQQLKNNIDRGNNDIVNNLQNHHPTQRRSVQRQQQQNNLVGGAFNFVDQTTNQLTLQRKNTYQQQPQQNYFIAVENDQKQFMGKQTTHFNNDNEDLLAGSPNSYIDLVIQETPQFAKQRSRTSQYPSRALAGKVLLSNQVSAGSNILKQSFDQFANRGIINRPIRPTQA